MNVHPGVFTGDSLGTEQEVSGQRVLSDHQRSETVTGSHPDPGLMHQAATVCAKNRLS